MNVREHSSSKLLLAVAALVLFSSVSFFSQPPASVASTSSTGVMVPLYAYPGSMWTGLIQAKQAHPSVPVIAIINPDNGPGTYQDPTVLHGVRSLQAAGITVIGYIYTQYASRSVSSVESNINAYKQLYGVSGIFFDQMSNVLGYEWYYSTLTSYVKSHGMYLSVGNPGTGVPSSFVSTVDLMIIYENAGLPSISLIASRTEGYGKQHFAITPYDVSYVSSSYILSASRYLSYLYITNGHYPDQYTALPGYFSSLMSVLAGSEGTSTGSVALAIKSEGPGGSVIDGMRTAISSDGSTLATGFTPLSYSANLGGHYVISASNYGPYVFSHWSNGDTSPKIEVTITAATTLVAYYTVASSASQGTPPAGVSVLKGASMAGAYVIARSTNKSLDANSYMALKYESSTGSTYTSAINYGGFHLSPWTGSSAMIIVEDVTSIGIPFVGLQTIVRSSTGQVVASGFSTLAFSATPGVDYTVRISNYGQYPFSHWGNGSTSQSITITASGLTILVAVYG